MQEIWTPRCCQLRACSAPHKTFSILTSQKDYFLPLHHAAGGGKQPGWDKGECERWGTEEICRPRGRSGLEDCSPPSAGARPAQGRGPGEFGRGTRGNNAFPRLPQHSAPASVSGVPVTARSPSPAPVATSGQAPRQLSIPGDCPVGGDALRSPAGPSPGGVVSSGGGFSCPPRQGCAGIAGSGNRGRDLQTRGRGPKQRSSSRPVSSPQERGPSRRPAGCGTGRSQRKSPKNNFWRGKGSPSCAGSDLGVRGRRVPRYGLPAEGERAPWTDASGDFTTQTQPVTCLYPPTLPAEAQGNVELSRTGTSEMSRYASAAEGTPVWPPAHRGRREYGVSSHAGGPVRPINFLPRTLFSSTKPPTPPPSPDPFPSSFPRKKEAAPGPAYLAWCWLPAPRSHEAGSPGTAPQKSGLNTRGGGSRRRSAPLGKPYLRSGSAGRGSAGCPPPGAFLPGGRPSPARRGAPAGVALGRGAVAGG